MHCILCYNFNLGSQEAFALFKQYELGKEESRALLPLHMTSVKTNERYGIICCTLEITQLHYVLTFRAEFNIYHLFIDIFFLHLI